MRALMFGALVAGAPVMAQGTNPWTPPGVVPPVRYPGDAPLAEPVYPGGPQGALDGRYAPAGLDAALSSGRLAPDGAAAVARAPGAPGDVGIYPPIPSGGATAASPFSMSGPIYAPARADAAPAAIPGGTTNAQAAYGPGTSYVTGAPYPLGTPMPPTPAPREPVAAAATPAPAATLPTIGTMAVAPVPGTVLPYAVPVTPGVIGTLPMTTLVPGAVSPGGYGGLPLAGYGATWPYAAGGALPYGLGTGMPYGAGAGLPYGAATGWPYGGGGWPGSYGTGWPYSGFAGVPGGYGAGLPGLYGTGWPGGLGTGWPTTGYSPFGFR